MRILILTLLVVGCSSTSMNESEPVPDSAVLDTNDAQEEAQTEAGPDGSADAGLDVILEAGSDGDLDATETGPDAACSSGATQCSGTNLETCVNGTWKFTQTCPYVCSNNACGGSCVPGTKDCVAQSPRTCGTNGEWVYSLRAPTPAWPVNAKGSAPPER